MKVNLYWQLCSHCHDLLMMVMTTTIEVSDLKRLQSEDVFVEISFSFIYLFSYVS